MSTELADDHLECGAGFPDDIEDLLTMDDRTNKLILEAYIRGQEEYRRNSHCE